MSSQRPPARNLPDRPVVPTLVQAICARVMLLVAAVVALTVLTSSPAHACSCAEDPGLAAHVQHDDVILTGTIEGPDGRWPWSQTVQYDVTVDRIYQGGPLGEVVGVESEASGDACGWEFIEPDRPYLVIVARTEDGALRGGLCDGTTPATPALVNELERLTRPAGDAADFPERPDTSIPRPGDPDTPWILGVSVAAVPLLGLATRWLRRCRRHRSAD